MLLLEAASTALRGLPLEKIANVKKSLQKLETNIGEHNISPISSGDGNRNKWLVEMKLSLIVFVQVATGIVQLILLGVCMFVIVHGYSWLLFYVYLNEDFLTLSQPYLMLILSAKVRYAVMQQLGCLPLHRLSATIPV
jgi:hypothetical protein